MTELEQQRRSRRLGLGVALIGLIVYSVCVWLVPSQFPLTEMFLLSVLSVYAEWRSVRLPVYGFLNPGEGFYLAASCLFGPMAGGVMSSLLGLAADLRLRKSAPVVIFNFGWALTTFGLVGAIYPFAGWLGASLVYVLVARTLQGVGQRTFFNLPVEQTTRQQFREAMLVTPASLGFCYLSVLLLELNPLALLTLAMPLELVFTYVRTRELSKDLALALKELELAQAELVATGRQAALGVMAAGIAHEINNPLAAAKTNLHMLHMMTDESAAPSLGLLEKSLDRCQNIVARMLKYSRKAKEGGQMCDVREVLNDAILFCGRKFDEQGVRLEIELPQGQAVKADPTELVQIFSNLLANAHDAGSSLVSVASRSQDGLVCLSVSDDGAGIPSEAKAQIFEPFFTTKAVGSGTGLGLSIAQGLARSHGGDLVLVSSSPGRTVFELRLRG